MIKALSEPGPDDQRTLILGLSDENWRRLRGGQPIPVTLGDLHPSLPNLTVLITGGATEQALMDDLRASGAKVNTVQPPTNGQAAQP
jgi:hypothetical protein